MIRWVCCRNCVKTDDIINIIDDVITHILRDEPYGIAESLKDSGSISESEGKTSVQIVIFML